MNFTGKPKVNILLVGLPGVGKTSLCQAFGTNFVDGFSYGVGLSKKAKIVELITEQNVYHVIDAPGLYDPRDEANTQRHASEISNNLNLSTNPYVVCFVICIQQHDMRVKQGDLMMMRAIKRFFCRGQVKFSVIINRLTENEFKVFADNSHFRKEFLYSFERDAAVTITDDDILLIHDKFLTFNMQDRKELLTSYLKKFEAGHMSDFARLMKNTIETNSHSTDDFMASYLAYSKAYQNEVINTINQSVYGNQSNYMQTLQQSIQEQQKQQAQLMQQILGGKYDSYNTPCSTPQQNNQFNQFMPGNTSPPPPNNNNFMDQYAQQAAFNSSNMTNNYLNQYLSGGFGMNQNNNPYQSPLNGSSAYSNNPYSMGSFQQTSPSPAESTNSSSTNNMFNAAGAFVGGAMGIPTSDFSQGNSNLYGAAGQFVGGAVTAGCTIM